MSEDFVPECKKGYSVMQGGKTVNFTNQSQYQETVEVNLVSASWDEVQLQRLHRHFHQQFAVIPPASQRHEGLPPLFQCIFNRARG